MKEGDPSDIIEKDYAEEHRSTQDATGGGIRGAIRTYITRFTKSAAIGSLPIQKIVPRNPAKLGKAISNVGQVVDFHGAVTEASSTNNKRKGWIHIAKSSIPVLVKNSVLGALQFTVYDFIVAKTKNFDNNNGLNDCSAGKRDDATQNIRTIPIALFGGFLSGSLHGIGHLLWENMATVVSRDREAIKTFGSATSRGGLVLLHALSHSFLFGSYTATKFISHPSPGETKEQFLKFMEGEKNEEYAKVEMLHRLTSIAFSGFLAGCVEEAVNHKFGWLQIAKEQRKVVKSTTMNPRLLFLAGAPSMIGFLALEMG